MLPALSLAIIAPTGGDHMQMGMILPIAPMCMEHHDIATPEWLAPDGAVEIIEALYPTAQERAQHDCRILVKGRAKHRRDREDDMPIDHPRMEDPAHLADPVIDVDLGAAQAQGRFTTHRHQMLALATLQAAVFDIAHLLWVATRQHLGHEAFVVGRPVTRMGVGKRVPVIGKDLLEDVPVQRGCCKHQGAPSWGGKIVVVQRLYHTSPAQSTPSAVFTGHPYSPHCP